MADHEQRLKRVRGHLRDAHDELHSLPAEEQQAEPAGLARLDGVVTHAEAVLAATDAPLLSTGAFTAIQSAACTISNSPGAALQEADGAADAILDALATLPLPCGGLADHEAMARKLAEFEQTLTAQRQALDEFRAELSRAQEEALADVEQRVDEIRRREEESATLLERIAHAGMSEASRRQGRRHRVAAELLRALTVLAALGAVAVALLTAGTDPTAEALVASLFGSLVLAGLAAYFGAQSSRHHAREEQARALQLELAAFGPFIEALPAERQEEERVIMTRKLFGTPLAAAEQAPATAEPTTARANKPLVLAGDAALGQAALEGSANGSRSNGHAPL